MVQQDVGKNELDLSEITGYSSWRHPSRTLRIYMHHAAVGTLQSRVLLAFFAARPSEVGGILLGKIRPGKLERSVVIDEVQFIQPTGQLFNANEVDTSRLESAVKRIRTDTQLTPVGYFRSHVREGLELSSQDRSFVEKNLRDPDAVSLLIRTDEVGICTAAFFFWQGGQLQTKPSELEIRSITDESCIDPLPVGDSTAREPVPQESFAAEPPHPVVEHHEPALDLQEVDLQEDDAVQQENAPTVTPGNAASLDTNSFTSPGGTRVPMTSELTREPRSDTRTTAVSPGASLTAFFRRDRTSQPRNLLAWALACVLLATLCVVAYFALQAGRLRNQGIGNQGGGTDVGLRVDAVPSGQLNVSWNQQMPQLGAMQRAMLTIVDGSVRRELEIDRSQFRFGKLTYVPNSTDVQFQLEVFLSGGRSMAESMRVVVSSPPGGTFQAQQVPPREIEAPVKNTVKVARPQSGVGASAKSPPPYTSRLAAPVTKQRTGTTNELSGIKAPEVPASASREPSISFAQNLPLYPPPKRDVGAQTALQPTQKSQNTNATSSTYIPPFKTDAASLQTTRVESTERPAIAAGEANGDQARPNSALTQTSAVPGNLRSQTRPASNFTPPVVIREVQPTVPLGLAGVINSEQAVDIQVYVGPDGRVTQAHLLTTKGAVSGLLSQAALNAVHRYRFRPARRNGVAVASSITITFRFVR
jgi:TonB family protein